MHASLWAPWRLAYLRDLDRKAEAADGSPQAGGTGGAAAPAGTPRDGDFLRAAWERPELDAANFVVDRTAAGLILLNRYPYANGHLLVALGKACPALLDYLPQERAALWGLVDRAVDLCHRAFRPHGVNIGVNEGRAAGAGVPSHLHVHVVPRWDGDTNFMSVVGEVRVIPDALESVAAMYRAAAGRG